MLIVGIGSVNAAQIRVPADVSSLQAAIDVAQSGDEIVIAPGVYPDPVLVVGKSLTLRSSTGDPADVVLRAADGGTVLRVDNAPSLRLDGLTLRDGTGSTGAICGSGGLTVFGGAIIATNSGLVIDRCMITNNTAEIGGALFLVGGSVTIRNTTLSMNGVVSPPGGTASVGSVLRTCGSPSTTILIEDSIVRDNGDASGALAVITPLTSPTTVRRTRFENNSGGVIQPSGTTDLLVEESLFLMNTGIRPAISTALSGPDALLRVRRSMFVGNPGDVFASMPEGESSVEITDSRFINSTDQSVFYFQQPGSSAIINRCEFRGGSSILLSVVADSGQTLVANSLFVGAGADAVLIANPSNPGVTIVENCTIADNAGLGLRSDVLLTGTLSVRNSILARNAGGQIGRPLIPFGQTLEVRSSLVQGGFAGGVGVIDLDPAFVGDVNGDYRLRPESPAIDAGNNALITPIAGAGPALDLDLLPRRVDAANPDTGVGPAPIVDLGAFEFQAAPVCAADFDASDTLTVDDIFVFLNAWFADAPDADFDASGTRTVDDIFVFLNAWFAGC
jgi:hypothetical protein